MALPAASTRGWLASGIPLFPSPPRPWQLAPEVRLRCVLLNGCHRRVRPEVDGLWAMLAVAGGFAAGGAFAASHHSWEPEDVEAGDQQAAEEIEDAESWDQQEQLEDGDFGFRPQLPRHYLRIPRGWNAAGNPLKHSANLLARTLNIQIWKAQRMAQVLQAYVVELEGEDPTGSRTKRWVRKLLRGLEKHPSLKPILFDGDYADTVIDTIVELDKRSRRHTAKVDAIHSHHRELREGDDGNEEEYADAVSYMGNEWWVKAAHDNMAKWIDGYYLLTPEQLRRGYPPWAFKMAGMPKGFQKYTVAGKTMYWNPSTKKMQREAPARVDNSSVAPPSREPPVALLDVGSCTNPFRRFPFLVEPVALDLQPGTGAAGVFQADFLQVPIVDATDNNDPKQRVLVSPDGHLDGIVAGSFDVVVLSLVLSCVPEPQQRIDMIARARRCLRDDRGLLCVVEVGTALANSKWYGGDAFQDWKNAIEAVGFRIKLFEDEVKEFRPYKTHTAFQWVFETAPALDAPLQPLLTPKDMPW